MEVNIELAKRLLEEQYFVNGDNKIRTQNPIRVEDLAFIMQKYTDEQLLINDVVKSFTAEDVLNVLEDCEHLDDAKMLFVRSEL